MNEPKRTNATLKAMQGGIHSEDETHPLYVLAAELEASEADLIRRNEELQEAANRWKEYYRAAYGHPWESRNRNYQGL